MYCAFATVAWSESSEYFDIDQPITHLWSRAHWKDPFDDTEHQRLVWYTNDAGEYLAVIRAQADPEQDCTTRLLLAIPTENLTAEQNAERSKAFNRLNRSSQKVSVSFNFKRVEDDIDERGRPSHKLLDDLKILDLDFEDSWDSEHVLLHQQEPSTVKRLVSALTESYEVRIRVKLYGEVSNIKTRPQEILYGVRVDMKPIYSRNHFKEKWAWATKYCEDEAVDLQVENDQEPEDTKTE